MAKGFSGPYTALVLATEIVRFIHCDKLTTLSLVEARLLRAVAIFAAMSQLIDLRQELEFRSL